MSVFYCSRLCCELSICRFVVPRVEPKTGPHPVPASTLCIDIGWLLVELSDGQRLLKTFVGPSSAFTNVPPLGEQGFVGRVSTTKPKLPASHWKGSMVEHYPIADQRRGEFAEAASSREHSHGPPQHAKTSRNLLMTPSSLAPETWKEARSRPRCYPGGIM